MKKIAGLLVWAVLLAACSGSASPGAGSSSAPAGTSKIVSVSSESSTMSKEVMPQGITSWVLKPSIQAEDIQPIVNDLVLRNISLADGLDELLYTRDDYFWAVAQVRYADRTDLIDYSGAVLHSTPMAQDAASTHNSEYFYHPPDLGSPEHALDKGAIAFGARGMAPQWLDRNYQVAGNAIIPGEIHSAYFCWDEQTESLHYYEGYKADIFIYADSAKDTPESGQIFPYPGE